MSIRPLGLIFTTRMPRRSRRRHLALRLPEESPTTKIVAWRLCADDSRHYSPRRRSEHCSHFAVFSDARNCTLPQVVLIEPARTSLRQGAAGCRAGSDISPVPWSVMCSISTPVVRCCLWLVFSRKERAAASSPAALPTLPEELPGLLNRSRSRYLL